MCLHYSTINNFPVPVHNKTKNKQICTSPDPIFAHQRAFKFKLLTWSWIVQSVCSVAFSLLSSGCLRRPIRILEQKKTTSLLSIQNPFLKYKNETHLYAHMLVCMYECMYICIYNGWMYGWRERCRYIVMCIRPFTLVIYVWLGHSVFNGNIIF